MRTSTPGSAVSMQVVVGPADAAAVDGTTVHEVYGTAAMIAHTEQLSRWLLAMGLDAGEEGVGKAISLVHHAPVPVGAEVDVVATVRESSNTELVTEVAFRHDGVDAATASFTQLVLADGRTLADGLAGDSADAPGPEDTSASADDEDAEGAEA